MRNPLEWVWASAQAGMVLAGASPVPICRLHDDARENFIQHLHTLDASDRYLRFGYGASNAQIERYVQNLNLERDRLFGVYGHDLRLLAVAHLAMLETAPDAPCKRVEFGVSVNLSARAKGMGRALYHRCALYARNAGMEQLYIFVLRENTAMVRIAKAAQADMTDQHGELDCWVQLEPATLETRLVEYWEDQRAHMDYQLKSMLSPRHAPSKAEAPSTAPAPAETVA